ncbi:hypothetical protein [Nostoc sp.]|uniref:hypothetical protein n=1 Tax=Nostoc sp. TaxID=1180 RepID=UPI002FFA4647
MSRLILNNTLRVPFPTGRQGRTGSKLRVASGREARRRHRNLTFDQNLPAS